MGRLILTRSHLVHMIAHARAQAPFEACGLLGGTDGCVREVFPMVNALQSPTRYEMEPKQLLSVLEEMERRGWGPDPLGIFHSHPNGPETPSETDVAEAQYPNSVYIIIAHPDRPAPAVRGFRIVNSRVIETELKILGGYHSPR